MVPKYIHMSEVVARYVKRYRTLAVHKRVLMRRVMDRHGYSQPFVSMFDFPTIGYLKPHPVSGYLMCEALIEYEAVMDDKTKAMVARTECYRDKQLKKWLQKNPNASPQLFESFVIQTELEGILKEKENAKRYER